MNWPGGQGRVPGGFKLTVGNLKQGEIASAPSDQLQKQAALETDVALRLSNDCLRALGL